MNVLAFETATGRPSLFLRVGEQGNYRWAGERRPSPDIVMAAVDSLLKEAGLPPAELDFVACGRGPGAFTGVRLGIALAQGFALGAGCPVVGVSDLLALAWKARAKHGWEQVLALLDARQGEVYQAGYDFSQPCARECIAECLIKPEEVRIPTEQWALAGSGAALLEAQPALLVDADLAPDAKAIAQLALHAFAAGEAVMASQIAPVYLRNQVATPKARP